MSTYTDIRFTSDDGLQLYTRDYAGGGGPARLPVVCLHGLTRNSADFDEFAPAVAAWGRRVLAPDVRGRGHSERDPDPTRYNQRTYAADVAKLMFDLGIGRAVFVGTSMGGLITMTLAELHPDLVAAAVLNDIGPVLSEKGLNRILGYVGKTDPQASWDGAACSVRAIHACAFPDYADDDWDRWARRAFAAGRGGLLEPRYDPAIADTLRDGKLKPTSPEIQAAFRRLAHARPTLLVRGLLSDLLEAEQAEWMRREAPSMQYAEVPHVGHAPMLNEAAALEAIRRFLDTLP